MDQTLGMVVATAIIGVAAWTLTLWWLREPQRSPTPTLLPARPMDGEPHTLTVLGSSGRPNPLQYERLPTYAAALTRQRELARLGKACIITHSESGEVRIDLSAWLGPYGRLYL
ncbi:MAG TPA: hypothetical protein VK196_16175 [Magnetospirillum sp.]|nr:hypothetical protein [Magnetospirillum sp.]